MMHGVRYVAILAAVGLGFLRPAPARADGGFVSKRSVSVAVSADQRAIIIRNGDFVSTTFSTAYSGEGEDFGWIIPVPVPPAIEDVYEAGKEGEEAFRSLDRASAPSIGTSGGGCFPAGTEVLTAQGPRPIESVEPGAEVWAYDFARGSWVLSPVKARRSRPYRGDIVEVSIGGGTVQATGNHPFFVLSGPDLPYRTVARDVPEEERTGSPGGRWVEARDLRRGDRLRARGTGTARVTGVSRRAGELEVHNLEVERYHTYAVHREGLLVHNKGSSESPRQLVTVYGTATLAHYEVSVVGAASSSSLGDWLGRSGFRLAPGADVILEAYVRERSAFVAVRLTPDERRHYENEFLPPLTIQYQHDELVFPLRISSISTRASVRVTLYVLAESTVSSTNVVTRPLEYRGRDLAQAADPGSYVADRLLRTIGSDERALVVMHKSSVGALPLEEPLTSRPHRGSGPVYLTRLEARIEPAAMTEDIALALDRKPRQFSVSNAREVRADEQVRVVVLFAILGLVGIMLIAIAVLFLAGMVYSLVTAVRGVVRWVRELHNRRWM